METLSIFESCQTTKQQGNLGEARAIYEYTRLGYIVSKPLVEDTSYDLLIDDRETIYRVQIKTCKYKGKTGGWDVGLTQKQGNTKRNTYKPREQGDYDILFVLTDDNQCWSIPATVLSKTSITLGNTKYQEFQL